MMKMMKMMIPENMGRGHRKHRTSMKGYVAAKRCLVRPAALMKPEALR